MDEGRKGAIRRYHVKPLGELLVEGRDRLACLGIAHDQLDGPFERAGLVNREDAGDLSRSRLPERASP